MVSPKTIHLLFPIRKSVDMINFFLKNHFTTRNTTDNQIFVKLHV